MTSDRSVPPGGFDSREDMAAFFLRTVTIQQRTLTKQAYYVTRDWHIAEDVVQEAFVGLYLVLARNGGIDNVDAWLARVTYCIAVDHVRKTVRRQDAHSTAPDRQSETLDPSGTYEQNELQKAVLSAIPLLPDQQALVVYMRHIEELTHEQIARRLESNPSTVRSTYRQGISRLRSLIKQHLP